MRRVLPFLLLAHIALAQSPFRAQPHFDDPKFAADAQAALDKVWQLATRMFGPPDGTVSELVVHAYAERSDYATASETLGGPDPMTFPGFADHRTRTGHYYVGTKVRDDDGRLRAYVRDGITHEAMHLAVAAIRGHAEAFAPRWFGEGLAMWAEVQVEGGARPAGTGDVRNDAEAMRDLFEVGRAGTLHRDGRVPKATTLLAGESGALSRQDEYPVFRVLFELLMEQHAAPMQAMLRDSLTLPSSPAQALLLRDLVQKHLGHDAWRTLDERFAQRLETIAAATPKMAFPPPDDQKGKVGDPDYHPGSPVVAWAGTHDRDRLQVDAKLTIRDAGPRQADFVFGQHGKAWLRVCFVDGGGVLVLGREQDGEAPGGWVVLGRGGDAATVVVGKAAKVRLVAAGGEVRVDVDGKRIVTAKCGKRTGRGRWGMGAPQGGRASWQEVKVGG